MPRLIYSFFAALSMTLLLACSKAPAPPAAPVAPVAQTAPAAPAPAATALTYQCSSPEKSRAIFLRFDDDGALSIGADAASLKPTGDVVLFDHSGMANWTTTLPNGSETNNFDKTNKEWIWQERSSNNEVVDQATYSCKAL